MTRVRRVLDAVAEVVMDISVSRLNNRMALQVPGELPLGLVFVVGDVENLGELEEGTVQFELEDAGYRLCCHLPVAVAEETLLKEKDRVRASGQLVFDSRSAQYRLLARDIEVLAARPPSEKPARERARDVRAEANAASLVPTKLPPWVQKLAPPEVKEELALEAEDEVDKAAAEADIVEKERQFTGDRSTELPPEMVAFLSNAIDSDEEIELTPEMIAEYLPRMGGRSQGAGEGEPTVGAAEERPTVAEDVAGMAAREPYSEQEVGGGGEQTAAEAAVSVSGPTGESGPAPPEQTADPAEGSEATAAPEMTRPRTFPPPQGAPRRESQRQPEPSPSRVRQYIEYGVIVLLVFLIMAALIVAVVLLQT